MRLRIIARPTGSIDGVPADQYLVGAIYDLGAKIACLFLAEGWAEPVSGSAAEALVRPPPTREAPAASLVLVVDDDAELRRFTESLLIAHGYHVMVAAHGQEAIERLGERCPALIVLDLNMPVMDGWQFRRAQCQLQGPSRAAVPVLLLTGADDAATHAEALRAVGIVRKPFDPADLLGAVSAAIGTTPSARADISPGRSAE